MTLSRLIPWRQRPPIVIDATALASTLLLGSAKAALYHSDPRGCTAEFKVQQVFEGVGS